jgi:hypothetical protein
MLIGQIIPHARVLEMQLQIQSHPSRLETNLQPTSSTNSWLSRGVMHTFVLSII